MALPVTRDVSPLRQRSNGGIVSTTTTRSRVLRSAGLVIAPLMLFGLAACGGDDDDDTAGGSSGDSAESFCNEIKDISAQGDEFEATSDDATPEELMDQLGQIVDRMQGLDPPGEIEDDWNKAMEVLETMSSGSVEDAASLETT